MVHPRGFFFHDHQRYRELTTLSFITFIFGIIYGLFSLYLPIFINQNVASIAWTGLLLALPEISGVLFDLPIGAFADRYGRRKTTLLGGISLFAIALLLQSWSSLLAIAFFIFCYGILTQLVIVPTNAELMAISPHHRSGKFFGIYEALHNFGFSVGPFLGGFLLLLEPPPIFFALAILALVFFFFVLFFMERRRREEAPFLEAAGEVIRKDHFFEGSAREFLKIGGGGWLLLLFWFTFAFRWGAFALLEPIFTTKLGVNPIMIGLIYAASTLPFIFFSSWAGNFADTHGVKRIIVLSLFLMGSATFLLGTFENAYILFALSFLAAVGDALLVPVALGALNTLASHRLKGRISGVVTFTESAGYLFGPLLGGSLAHFFGFSAAFYIFGIFIFLVMLAAVFAKFS